MSIGLCCISLVLKDRGFAHQTMTFQRFSALPREEALATLGERILNNLQTTNATISYCAEKRWAYRVSSSLFPLITYAQVNVELEDLPNHDDIQDEFDNIETTIKNTGVRVSCHPGEFTVLASLNEDAVAKSIDELNFYSSFFDRIGLPANHLAPMNFHVHSTAGSKDEIVSRFMCNFDKLDDNCKARVVIENDDKINCWSVRDLLTYFRPVANLPITFDYLHHKCHPDNMSEQEAVESCYATWDTKPLFHYSESAPGSNPRKHADYATSNFSKYDLEFDTDYELKEKDLAIIQWENTFE